MADESWARYSEIELIPLVLPGAPSTPELPLVSDIAWRNSKPQPHGRNRTADNLKFTYEGNLGFNSGIDHTASARAVWYVPSTVATGGRPVSQAASRSQPSGPRPGEGQAKAAARARTAPRGSTRRAGASRAICRADLNRKLDPVHIGCGGARIGRRQPSQTEPTGRPV